MSPRAFLSPAAGLRSAALLFALAILLVASSRACPALAAQSDLIAYTMVDQWPQRTEADQGILQGPADLDVASDGRVYIADPVAGGVHTLLAGGGFVAPFGVTGGYPAQLGAVGQAAVGPVPGQAGTERLYVLDTATKRLVLYSLDGTYLDAWEDIDGAGVAASSDGRVYVLDRATSQVAVLDAATGSRRFTFGGRGTEDGSFSNFSDVSISADGRIAAVGDKRGMRVQLFDLATDEQLAAASPPEPAKLRKAYDLLDARYNKGDNSCRGERVNALGDNAVFVGEGTTACIIDGTKVTYAIAASANNGTVCRATVRLPSLRADTGQYYALATYDPNSGACGNKRTDLQTSPVVLRYDDEELRSVRTVWTAQSNDGSGSQLMFGPERLSMPADDQVFVQDRSQSLRFYSTDGQQLATAARDSIAGDESTETTFMMLTAAEGSETLGEVYGAYVQMRRSGGGGPPMPPGPGRPLDAPSAPSASTDQAAPSQAQVESGIGRFRTVKKVVQGQTMDVLEPIWKVASTGTTSARGRWSFSAATIAFDRFSGELLVVHEVTVAAQRSNNVVVDRYATDGTQLSSWDVPDDGKVNPYADIAVGADGCVYLLDDLDDVVRVLLPDGTPDRDVPVATDARAVAGGPADPAGSVFVLREAGAIERYDDAGRITARLDGRPLAFSDPTTLTDLVVDTSGRVYVADGQSSLISVFQPTQDPDALPVPDDGQCLFVGRKAVDPGTVELGHATTVRLGLKGTCAVAEQPSDIVVVAPYFGELQQGVDPSTTALADLLRLASRVDFTKHRMALVTYYTSYTVDLPLTHDGAAYSAAVRAIQRYSPPNQDVKARLANAMGAGARLFDSDPGHRKVMVLVDALYCDPNNERFAGQCAGYPPAEDTANAIRADGVTIVVAGSFDASNLASSDEDFVMDVASAHQRMVGYRLPDWLARSVEVTDELPANMALDQGTVTGGGTWRQPVLAWSSSDVDFDGLGYSYDVTPTQPGRWPTNVSASAAIADGWGNEVTVDFPSPEVEVIGPTATPVPDTPTPTPQPTATATEVVLEHHQVYLPWLSDHACDASKDRLDLVVALDVSNSMRGGKLDTARQAVRALLAAADLSPDGNRAALVTFAYTATLAEGLTGDRARLDAALGAAGHRAGTRIDHALEAAASELEGPNGGELAGKAVVVVSDGGQTEAPDQAGQVARALESRGMALYTIAVGADANAAVLASVAGSQDRVFAAGSSFQPEAVIRQITGDLSACP